MSNYKSGKDRRQTTLFPRSLEDCIPSDSEIRLIDAFVDSLELLTLGFKSSKNDSHKGGASSFAPQDLLKLYIWGYLNGIRSTRKLAHMTRYHIEVLWLLNSLEVSHMTISRFRSENPKALRAVLRSYNSFLEAAGEYWGDTAFGKEMLVIDGSKFKGQNSKANNYNANKIKEKQAYLDKKVEGFLLDLESSENSVNESSEKLDIAAKIEVLEKRKQKYDELEKQLTGTTSTQVSLTDPDSRLLILNDKSSIVGYNVQMAVDKKHKLVTDFAVTNTVDSNALYPIASSAKSELGLTKEDKLAVVADTGYYNGKQMAKCEEANITSYIAVPSLNRRQKVAQTVEKSEVVEKAEALEKPEAVEKTEAIKIIQPKPKRRGNKYYGKQDFTYDKDKDAYTCHYGKQLKSDKALHKKKTGQRVYYYKSKPDDCATCPFKSACIQKGNKHKRLDRGEYEDQLDANRKRLEAKPEIYKLRKEIVEHPFGVIKRNWGYTYTLLKGKSKVAGEFSLIYTAYNIRRSVSIYGVAKLLEVLKSKKDGKSTSFAKFSALCASITPPKIVAKRRKIKPIAGSMSHYITRPFYIQNIAA